MKRKDSLKRLLEGTTVDYAADTIYLELAKDLVNLETIKKDTRSFSNEEVQAAEAELGLKWQLVNAELSAYLNANKAAERIRSRILLQRKVKELHLAEVENNKPADPVPVPPPPIKTIREKLTNRQQTRNEKRLKTGRDRPEKTPGEKTKKPK